MASLISFIIIVGILVLFFKSIGKSSDKNYKNEMVSLGVLGTFVGIAMGLYHFDVTDIKESMPILLEGLKTAFITSGFGIFFSILTSIIKPLQKDKSETLTALEMVVKEFNQNLTEQFGDNFKQLNESVKNMIIWQENYKTHIKASEDSLVKVYEQLEHISILKQNEEENIKALIDNLAKSSQSVKESLEESTEIVKENMQLLLREANGKV